MTLTAIIVTYDSAAVLPACLDALKRQGAACLVVDNASHDDSVAIAQAQGARVVQNARNEGYGRANNRGIACATDEWFLICNPDIVLDDGAMQALLAASQAYPDAGMWAPRLIEADGRFFFQGRSLLRESVASVFKRFSSNTILPSGDCCAPFLSGACFLMRRALFLKLGGFDDRIFLFYEDDDLCRRVMDAGYALVHVHRAIARHGRGRSSVSKAGRIYKSRWHQAWSRAYVIRKYNLSEAVYGLLTINGLKALLACLVLRRSSIERYAGSFAGAFAFLHGRSALEKEGLTSLSGKI